MKSSKKNQPTMVEMRVAGTQSNFKKLSSSICVCYLISSRCHFVRSGRHRLLNVLSFTISRQGGNITLLSVVTSVCLVWFLFSVWEIGPFSWRSNFLWHNRYIIWPFFSSAFVTTFLSFSFSDVIYIRPLPLRPSVFHLKLLQCNDDSRAETLCKTYRGGSEMSS